MFENILNFLPTLATFLGGLSLLVLIHELGHYLVAKRAGIKVDEFGLGFPPRVLAKRVGETVYSLNAIPIGGFVKLHGEDDQVKTDEHRAYYYKSKGVRTAVVVSGVLANLVLAFVAFSLVAYNTSGIVQLAKIQPDSPAQAVGLQEGDVVLKVDSNKVFQLEQFQVYVGAKVGQEIALEVQKADGALKTVKTTPRRDPPEGQGALGVALRLEHYPGGERYLKSLGHGADQTLFWAGMTFEGIKIIGGDLAHGRAPEGVSGPVGILRVTEQVAQFGLVSLLNLLGIISINLAIINLLPIPALDGGRLLFIAVEAIFGKRVLPTFERYAHTVGFALLITLILMVTFKDIVSWLSGKSIFPTP